MKTLRTVMLLALLALTTPALAEVELQALVSDCDACHGKAGVSTDSDVPTIAGQSAEFLSRTMNSYQIWGRPCIKSAYRHGDTSRPATDMCKVASGMSSEDIQAVAEYYSQQTFVPAAQPFDADKAKAGAALHQQNCESCHKGGGTETKSAPRLAGQWTPYLRSAFKFVPTGEHLVPPLMEHSFDDLSAADFDALMNYYASQQGE